MSWLSFLAFLLLQDVGAIPLSSRTLYKRGDAKLTRRETKAFAPATELTTTENVAELKNIHTSPRSSKALRDVLAVSRTALQPVEDGGGYGVTVGVGSQSFVEVFDTGSSDLWVAQTGVKCVNANLKSVPASDCDFGTEFTGGFDEGQIANENFNISYGSGEFLIGNVGYEDVTVAGVSVNHQEMALVTEAYFESDGIISGILGFAYSSLTNAYSGTNPTVDSNANQVVYTDWLHSAINEGKFSPMFSLALERGANGGSGQLALGGLPSITFDHTFASTPIEMIELTPHPIEKTHYSYYTITPDDVVVNGESASTTFPVIVDSGTTLVYLPNKLAVEINDLYDPPSVYNEDYGVFENDCDATPPTFAITIGGTSFKISSHELLLQGKLGKLPNGGCVTGIQPGGTLADGIFILGDVFLKNVVAVFDIGASEMRFAPHVNY